MCWTWDEDVLMAMAREHFMALGCSEVEARAIYEDLAMRYGHGRRAYHNLGHISDMLLQWQHYREDLEEPYWVAMAIWFHDVIYEAGRSDNERASAQYMREVLSCYVEEEGLRYIEALIEATEYHRVNEQRDCGWFLDFDLSVLGRLEADYKQYCAAIWAEYEAIVSHVDYKKGRCAVLLGFLERPKLYFTLAYRTKYEAAARTNIYKELEELGYVFAKK